MRTRLDAFASMRSATPSQAAARAASSTSARAARRLTVGLGRGAAASLGALAPAAPATARRALGARRLLQKACQPSAGAMQSIVSGPCSAAASAAASTIGGMPPSRTVSIAFSSVRRLAMITLSLVPRCSRVRSWIAPMLSTAHWSCRLMSSSPMPR